jgi:hypothetical protein
MKIAFVVTATGAYFDHFFDDLARSILERAFPSHQVSVLCLTDRSLPARAGVRFARIERLGWPFDSLLKFHRLREAYPAIDADFLFCVDADMLVVGEFDAAILGSPLCAVVHPSFYNRTSRATFETDPISTAFVPKERRRCYYQGCLFGGQRHALASMIDAIALSIEADLSRAVIAVWHDESHLNKFASENAILALDPGYATLVARGDAFPDSAKVLHLHKENDRLRGERSDIDVASILDPSGGGLDTDLFRRLLNVQVARLSEEQRRRIAESRTIVDRLRDRISRLRSGNEAR